MFILVGRWLNLKSETCLPTVVHNDTSSHFVLYFGTLVFTLATWWHPSAYIIERLAMDLGRI